MRYVITFVNTTKKKRYCYVIVILNIQNILHSLTMIMYLAINNMCTHAHIKKKGKPH